MVNSLENTLQDQIGSPEKNIQERYNEDLGLIRRVTQHDKYEQPEYVDTNRKTKKLDDLTNFFDDPSDDESEEEEEKMGDYEPDYNQPGRPRQFSTAKQKRVTIR